MHSVFNRTNNDNGIAASLLNGELYRLGILIAVVVFIAALALLAGRRRLSRAYRLELDANPAGVARRRTDSRTYSSPRRRPRSHRGPDAPKGTAAIDDTRPANRPDGPATRTHRLGISGPRRRLMA
jgi:hypothetical protein